MDNITKKIAGYASSLSFNNLDEATRHAATQRLIDALGCGLGAHDCEPAQIGRRLSAGETPGKYAGRVLFYGDRLPAESAGFINTAMIRNFDFNDRYPGGHPSDALGPLIALASAMPVDGKRFLAAMSVMYEIFARLSDSTQLSRRGWDQGFAHQHFGRGRRLQSARAAAADDRQCHRHRGEFERAAARHPLGRAHAVEERRDRLCRAQRPVRRAASPPKAWRGRAMRSRGGQGCSRTSPGRSRSRTSRPRAVPSLTPRVQLKYWPVETNGQPVIWAALELRKSLAASDIKAIEVFANKFTWFEIGSEPEKWDPQTRETADHSLPYIFARALVDGPITTRSSFTDDKVRDPALRPLMSKLKVTVDDALEAMLPRMVLRVTATATDGKRAQGRDRRSRSAIPTIRCRTRTSRRSSMRWPSRSSGADRCRRSLDALWKARDADNIGALFAMLDLKPH